MTTVWTSEFTVPPDDNDGVCGIKFEDGGQAAIMYNEELHRAAPKTVDPADIDADNGFFIRLHSWDGRRIPQAERHAFFRSLMGKRIRVTIETIDPGISR